MQGNWEQFLSEGVLTLSTAAAIAVGIMVGSSLYTTLLAVKRMLTGERRDRAA